MDGFVKDLKYIKKIAKERKDMVLVDDNSESVNRNYPFAVQIKEFEGDQSDSELIKTYQLLLKFY